MAEPKRSDLLDPPRRTRPALGWTGAGAALTGAVWAVTQLFGGQAQARTPAVAQLEEKLDAVLKTQAEQGKVLLRIQCRLGFDDVCPERPPVRSSGIGR